MDTQVVIIGAGYAGVSAAKRLARSTARVTVINPRADFVERIRLHQMVAGNRTATLPLSLLLPGSTTLVRDSAESIDTDRNTVTLAGGREIGFDYLIHTAGSSSRLDAVPGAAEHAVTVGGLEDAVSARERLNRLPRGSTVTVVGGGLTGVEVASELAEAGGHRVRLVTDGLVAAGTSTKGRAYVRWYLAKLGVEVIEETAVTDGAGGRGCAGDGRVLDSDLSVMTAMFTVPPLARDSGLDTDEDGALRVKPSLVSTSSTAVVGAGDASRIVDNPLRMSCQAAVPLGAHAAETVLRLADGAEPEPVRPRFVGQCISLGRRSALWQVSNKADVPKNTTITGRVGAFVKEQISSSTVRIALNPRLARFNYSW
ncbi:NADH dehydrogenase [Haloactinospora alba]|uniref:NADH dehydrogenase n=1 Tax=Haloactinospora alba TaxID=405555 RepID=A0A543N7G7_9ACTN|nr:FAD-dependent oxidoreductase [Haloactinospora alba]TQN27774.1 NADH dehydrogenase [Haloactinospora alba]